MTTLREQIKALPKWDKRSVPGGFHVNRAAVLALIDAHACLDRERLARAIARTHTFSPESASVIISAEAATAIADAYEADHD